MQRHANAPPQHLQLVRKQPHDKLGQLPKKRRKRKKSLDDYVRVRRTAKHNKLISDNDRQSQ